MRLFYFISFCLVFVLVIVVLLFCLFLRQSLAIEPKLGSSCLRLPAGRFTSIPNLLSFVWSGFETDSHYIAKVDLCSSYISFLTARINRHHHTWLIVRRLHSSQEPGSLVISTQTHSFQVGQTTTPRPNTNVDHMDDIPLMSSCACPVWWVDLNPGVKWKDGQAWAHDETEQRTVCVLLSDRQ